MELKLDSRCLRTGKIVFKTEKEAANCVNEMLRRRTFKTVPTRYYQCQHCGYFHLTKKPNSNGSSQKTNHAIKTDDRGLIKTITKQSSAKFKYRYLQSVYIIINDKPVNVLVLAYFRQKFGGNIYTFIYGETVADFWVEEDMVFATRFDAEQFLMEYKLTN